MTLPSSPKPPLHIAALSLLLLILPHANIRADSLSFPDDTLAFANDTVFAYRDGRPSLRHDDVERYTARCFVMCRAVVQFKKFARFEPGRPPVSDVELARRIRKVAKRPPWKDALGNYERIVIPGSRNLLELSRSKPRIVQENIGLGWPTYFRPGNWRVLLPRLPGQPARVKAELDRVLEQDRLFVSYITTLPKNVEINHAILIFARKKSIGGDDEYAVYDPTFPEAEQRLHWKEDKGSFWYPPNRTFVGGAVHVWQVYGAPLQ